MNDNDIPVVHLGADGKIHDMPEGAVMDAENHLAMSIESRGDDDTLQVRIILTAPEGVTAPKMTAVFTMDAPDFGDDADMGDDSDVHKSALYAKAQIAALAAVLPDLLPEAFKEATGQAVKKLEAQKVRSEVISEVIANLAMLKADGDKDKAKAFVLDTLDDWAASDGPTPSESQKNAMCAKVYDQIDAL